MWLEPNQISVETVRILDEDGKLLADDPNFSEEELVDMYRWMVLSRSFDQRAIKIQRQGRIGTYGPFSGQEAAQVGSAYALTKKDWLFISYRESAASLVHGVPISQLFHYPMGHLGGACPPEDVNVFSPQIIIAAQALHGMGSAWASKYKGEDAVSVAYVGDGATSEGDFHEALNFAGVFNLPAIFFVQNNQYAISLPVAKQTASKSIAQKALAYGISGVQVDGNDVLAVYQTMKEAISRAKAGKPVLIEAITYRQGPHTTADDPNKYRQQNEVEGWLVKDPLKRFKRYLMDKGLWTEEQDEQEWDFAHEKVSEGLKQAEQAPKSELSEVFDIVYEKLPSRLKEQKESMK
jgi:pyruvate dehydrogenase E1 component alpha subunit